MRRKYIRILAFLMITVLMFDLGSLSISAETVSENQMLEEPVNDGNSDTKDIESGDSFGSLFAEVVETEMASQEDGDEENISSVSLGGRYSAAVTKDGSLYTWGDCLSVEC